MEKADTDSLSGSNSDSNSSSDSNNEEHSRMILIALYRAYADTENQEFEDYINEVF